MPTFEKYCPFQNTFQNIGLVAHSVLLCNLFIINATLMKFGTHVNQYLQIFDDVTFLTTIKTFYSHSLISSNVIA